MVGLLQAPMGTKLYERLSREGRILGNLSGDNVDGTTNIVPVMNLDRLREGYKSILKHIYSPENYYQRIKTLLREYPASTVTARVRAKDILPFLRSIFHLGIIGRERIHYWKLLAWTYFHHPKLIPLAVTLAVYGHHFQLVSEQHVL